MRLPSLLFAAQAAIANDISKEMHPRDRPEGSPRCPPTMDILYTRPASGQTALWVWLGYLTWPAVVSDWSPHEETPCRPIRGFVHRGWADRVLASPTRTERLGFRRR